LIECDTADGAGGVTADAGQCQHSVEFAREFAVALFHDNLGSALHVADAGVIAKAFPEFMDFFRSGFGQGADVRQSLHPTLPIRQDGFDLGLLEHDFGDPDGIWIASPTPGEIAGAHRKPFEQR
jgi:hypothetical protein